MRRFSDWLTRKLEAGGVWLLVIPVVSSAITSLLTLMLVELLRMILR